MGMDYRFAGSASYSRFEDELTSVAKLFGGLPIDKIKKEEKVFYPWGVMNLQDGSSTKFVFDKELPNEVIKFFNDPYGNFSIKETEIIYNTLHEKWEEVKEVSWQISNELLNCVMAKESWYIF